RHWRNSRPSLFLVVSTPAKNSAKQLSDTFNDFADSFARLSHTVFNRVGNVEAMQRTMGDWRGAGNKSLLERVFAGGIGKHEAVRIEPHKVDSRRTRKIHRVRIARVELCGFEHEFGPDRQCRTSAFEVEITIIVVANPCDRQQAFGVAGKP